MENKKMNKQQVFDDLNVLYKAAINGKLDPKELLYDFTTHIQLKYKDESFAPFYREESKLNGNIVTDYNEVLMFISQKFDLKLHENLNSLKLSNIQKEDFIFFRFYHNFMTNVLEFYKTDFSKINIFFLPFLFSYWDLKEEETMLMETKGVYINNSLLKTLDQERHKEIIGVTRTISRQKEIEFKAFANSVKNAWNKSEQKKQIFEA
jgi:hypothetical protein